MPDLNRLRDIVRGSITRAGAGRELTYEPDVGGWVSPGAGAPPSFHGGTLVETIAGPCVVIERSYDAESYHGTVKVSDCEVTADQDLPMLMGPRSAAVVSNPEETRWSRVIFLDLETTGLSGGAGTYAFLVGCGFFDNGRFETRQFFLTSFAAERALLAAVADWLSHADLVVTYNGKTFDLPVMEMRWLFHRMAPPLAEKPHLDMLHPARALWRRPNHRAAWLSSGEPAWISREVLGDLAPPDQEVSSCRLTALERALLGVTRIGDVPGFEIPGRYFAYVRTGDIGPLEPVLEHNRLDLISLAAVTARALRLVKGGPGAARDASECLALGRLYERFGQRERAIACYACAGEFRVDGSPWECGDASVRGKQEPFFDTDRLVRIEALRRLALQLRRERRFLNAAAVWQQILALDRCPTGLLREASEALAIHHEHRARDLLAAREFALRTLDATHEPRRQHAVEHRLTRLDRKMAVQRKGGPEAARLL